MAYPPLMSKIIHRRFEMTAPLPTDLFNLKCQFDAWRKTRSNRTKTPDHLLNAAADLLDRYSASMICRVCRLNPRTFHQRINPSTGSSTIETSPAARFFPLSLAMAPAGQQPPGDCRLLLERPDGARLSLSLPHLNEALISALCSGFLRSQDR
jgi:hypothetical protein